MDYQQIFNEWKTDPFFDESTRQELVNLERQNNETEIKDRFYKELEFGTGGLRGIMGAGTNRMNKYTVGKATYGFGMYIKNKYSSEDCKTRGIGSKLLEELEKREKGKTIFLYTDDKCTYQFYEHREFEKVGEKDIELEIENRKIPLKCLMYCKKII